MRLLLVEIDPAVVGRIRAWLGREEFSVDVVESPGDVGATPSDEYDVVLIGQPDGARLDLCRRLRVADPRVRLLMLTPQGTVEQAIAALEAGADDVLSREALSVRELAVRLRALVKRKRAVPVEPPVVGVGPLTIDLDQRTVHIQGRQIRVSQTELTLLGALAARPGRVIDRPTLVRWVWREEPVALRTLDSVIKRLRAQLGPAGSLIETVRGVGYRLAGRPIVRGLTGEADLPEE